MTNAEVILCSECLRPFGKQALPEACPQDGTFLVQSAPLMLVGITLNDKYLVEEPISKGASAIVYRAVHLALNRRVAVKILKDEIGQQSHAAERFRREMTIAGSLIHPHIATVHDSGFYHNYPFIVMELVEGKSLSELIAADDWPPDSKTWLELFAQVADALAFAHGKKLIHRDLKPSNIMISTDGQQAKVIDFGLAKDTSTQQARLTKTGQVVGTPVYMSPEQCLGTQLNAQSDIYSLGCIMYESCARHPVVKGDTLFEIMNNHLTGKPAALAPPKSDWMPANAIKQLEKVIFRCLQKKPARRYPSMHQLAADLKRIADGRNVAASPMRISPPLALLAAALLIVISLWWLNPAGRFYKSASVNRTPSVSNPARQIRTYDAAAALEKRIAIIREMIGRLRQKHDEAKAETAAAALKELTSYLTGKDYRYHSTQSEVHMVSIVSGDQIGRSREKQSAKVRVSLTDVPVILVLSSQSGERCAWSVEVGDGTHIAAVYTDGSKVEGLPAGIEVKHFHSDRRDWRPDSLYGQAAVNAIRHETGWFPASFVGMESPGGEPIAVGPDNQQWRASHLAYRYQNLYLEALESRLSALQLLDQNFYAIVPYNEINHSNGDGQYLYKCSLLQGLERICELHNMGAFAVAVDQDHQRFYAVQPWFEELHPTAKDEQCDLGSDVLDKNVHDTYSGITYDSKSKLVVLCHEIGDYFMPDRKLRREALTTFNPATRKWGHSFIAEETTGLCYDPPTDSFYCIGPGVIRSIKQYAAAGQLLREIKLTDPIDRSMTNAQMLCLNGYPTVIVNGEEFGYSPQTVHVIDPKTGKTIYAGWLERTDKITPHDMSSSETHADQK